MSATLLAVSLTSPEPDLAQQIDDAVRRGADLVELRADLIGDFPAIERVLDKPRRSPLILTIRGVEEGGAWDGDDAERVALIERLGLRRPGYIDVEWALWRKSANLRQKLRLVCSAGAPAAVMDRPRNELIVSHHDWKGTPADVNTIVEELAASPAEVMKAVFTARDAGDGVRVLDALRRVSARRRAAVFAMGEAGVFTRVLGPKFGAALGYAAYSDESAAAPGQLPLEPLLSQYRWRAVGPSTAVYGVVGWPIGHSRSPRIHNAAMAARRIDGVYVPFAVGPSYEEFARFAELISASEWLDVRGLSVTLPHKSHGMRWLRERGGRISPLAERCGAVNTLTHLGAGAWAGDNTDASGFLDALEGLPVAGARVAVLGAGGVALAVAVALTGAGAAVTVYCREPARAGHFRAMGCDVRSWDERPGRDADMMVNCTPIGMTPHESQSPLEARELHAGVQVIDTVYTPLKTRLLREAAARGARTLSGAGLFLAQAARQFEIWHGQAAPRQEMREAFERP